jgi:lipocalin
MISRVAVCCPTIVAICYLNVAVEAAKCPSYSDVANMSNPAVAGFQLPKQMGIWYEIYSHNLPVVSTDCHCTRYNNSLTPSGWSDGFECKKRSATGKLYKPHPTKGHNSSNSEYPGQLSESFVEAGVVAPPTAYWVLDVVEDEQGEYSSSLVYACSSEVLVKQEWVYLFSRTSTLDQATHDRWMAYMKTKDIDTSDITAVPQEGRCWNSSAGLFVF